MLKKIMILTFFIALLPFQAFADTVTTNTNNVPIQESYNSPRVIERVQSGTVLTKLGQSGKFYKVQYGNIVGWVYTAYTSEGGSYTMPTLPANSDFVTVAKARKEFVKNGNYYYSQDGRGVPLENNPNLKTIDCSVYVSDVLYHYAKLKGDSEMMKMGRGTSYTFESIGASLSAGTKNYYTGTVELTQFFERVPSIEYALPGDILCFSGHVEIYAGTYNGSRMVYSCGSNNSIRELESYMDSRATTCILRVK